jgi:uncharacterized protein (TIGR00369 family)
MTTDEYFPAALMHHMGFDAVVEDSAEGRAVVRYDGRPEFTHSAGTTVQGGVVTTWLDHAMARAVYARDPRAAVASLEIKVSFIARVPPGPSLAEARVVRWGRQIVFLEATLKSPAGDLLATASSCGKLLLP